VATATVFDAYKSLKTIRLSELWPLLKFFFPWMLWVFSAASGVLGILFTFKIGLLASHYETDVFGHSANYWLGVMVVCVVVTVISAIMTVLTCLKSCYHENTLRRTLPQEKS
jgi:hypothetical protein